MSTPLLVEIVAYAPTAFYHCTHCEVAWREMGATNRIHEDQFSTSLPEDLAQDYQQVSDWVREVFRRYCDQVIIKVIDAASVEGFWKTLRYGIRRYPAVIVGQKKFYGGSALAAAGEELEQKLVMSGVATIKS